MFAKNTPLAKRNLGSKSDLALVKMMACRLFGAIIWANAGLLSIGPLGTNFSEILIKIQNFLFTKMHVKILSAKWRPFYPEGGTLIHKPWTKWPNCYRIHSELPFPQIKWKNFEWNSIDIYPDVIQVNDQLLPNRRQTVTWISDDSVMRHIRVPLILIEYIDGLVQERRNSSALAMELRFLVLMFYVKFQQWGHKHFVQWFQVSLKRIIDVSKIIYLDSYLFQIGKDLPRRLWRWACSAVWPPWGCLPCIYWHRTSGKTSRSSSAAVPLPAQQVSSNQKSNLKIIH